MTGRTLDDGPFPAFIDAAAQIRSSGRWESVNAVILDLARATPDDSAWHLQTLAGLCASVFSEYLDLQRAYEGGRDADGSRLAWRARNLLELSVWSIFAAKDRESARRIYEDAGRDVAEIFSAFSRWGTETAQSSDWLEGLASARLDLAQRAAAEGVLSLDAPYKRVNEVAQQCGMGDVFRVSYKMLSKFAHPTAMQILAPPDPNRAARQRDIFYGKGCLYFCGAFEALEGSALLSRDSQ